MAKTQIKPVGIAAIDRSRSALDRASVKGDACWVVALLLRPTPSIAWLETYESTFSQLAVERRLAFDHDLNSGKLRRIYVNRTRKTVWAPVLRWLRGRARVVLRVSCPPSRDAAQKAMAEAQWLISTVNEAFERTMAQRVGNDRAREAEIATFSATLRELEQQQIHHHGETQAAASLKDAASVSQLNAIAYGGGVSVPDGVWSVAHQTKLDRAATAI